MIFTTSYKTNGMEDLLTALTKIANPKIAVELGVQQGASAIAIGKGLDKGDLYAYDLFEPTYQEPPFGSTHADAEIALQNIATARLLDKVNICVGDAFNTHKDFGKVDLLHVDICNHYDNILKILKKWYRKVNKFILLEGGVYNHWQKKCHFKPYNTVLKMPFIKDNYEVFTLRGGDDYALTILERK